MSTVTAAPNQPDLRVLASRMLAETLPAYLACGTEDQAVIRQLTKVINNPATTESRRRAALAAISLLLFPRHPAGLRAIDLDEYDAALSATAPQVAERLDREEACFAERLMNLLKDKSVSQAELARRIGVSESAVSMMLARRCRPQRRTLTRIAKALKVPLSELWPCERD